MQSEATLLPSEHHPGTRFPSTPVNAAKDVEPRELAAYRIQKLFRSYCDKKIFGFLKLAVCRAEQCMTYDMLKKLSPGEAALLRDPAYRARLRFRFGGNAFPPTILYKIFVANSVKYISGVTMLDPSEAAAQEACGQMGQRAYAGMVAEDVDASLPVMGTSEVLGQLSNKGRMRIAGMWDAQPYWLGGRGNEWRVMLDSDINGALRFDPTQHPFWPVVAAVGDDVSAAMSVMFARLTEQMPDNAKTQVFRQSIEKRSKTAKQRQRLRKMKLLYTSHLQGEEKDSPIDSGAFKNTSPSQKDNRWAETASPNGSTRSFRTGMSQFGMSTRGSSQSPPKSSGAWTHGGMDASDVSDAEGGDSLLQWSQKLSYEDYQRQWDSVAATSPPRGI